MQVKWWMEMQEMELDMVMLGDINLDWLKWSSPSYQLSTLVEVVKTFQAETAMLQTV